MTHRRQFGNRLAFVDVAESRTGRAKFSVVMVYPRSQSLAAPISSPSRLIDCSIAKHGLPESAKAAARRGARWPDRSGVAKRTEQDVCVLVPFAWVILEDSGVPHALYLDGSYLQKGTIKRGAAWSWWVRRRTMSKSMRG